MCAMAKVNFENSSVTTKSKGIPLGNNVSKKPGGLRHCSKIDKRTCSEISFKEFLNFLRTAYQINENIESNSTDINIDWNEVATSELVSSLMGINKADLSRISQQCKEKLEENIKRDDNANNLEMSFYPIEKSMSSPLEKMHFNKKDSMANLIANKKLSGGSKSLEHIMKRKLNEVIQEGLLDSILPYVVPKLGVTAQPLCKKISNSDTKRVNNNSDKNIHNLSSSKDKSTAARRKSSCGEIEVEIHVCDEVKNLKRDFKCSQKLLVSKMGYFAEVTTGQKLEDMDISVHCDITIFDWLMRWVKKDISNESNPPTLDAGNVVPILVSAAFLQMDPLLEDCLEFCRRNINEIIKASTNLSCLNDNILTRLANMFSNSEVEALRDRKDKIQSRFYCKLIASLAEPNPDSSKGHFASLGGLYQCSKCGKLILRQLASKIPCKANQMKMDTLGNVHNTHVRDINWSLNDYVRSLKQELRTWRAVYWRLWGDCHYLSCSTCNNIFPTHQAQWCFHHADQPQFFTMEHQRTMTFPIGRYPCCGERAYRFEVLCSESGCQFKEHVPKLSTERETAIHKIFSSHIKLIAVEPPLLMFPERLTRLVSSRDCLEGGRSGGRELQWWDGLELAPPCPKQSLFSRLWDREHPKKDVAMPATPESTSPPKAPTGVPRFPRKPTSVAADACEGPVTSDDDSDSSAESDNSEESGHATVRVTTKPRLSEKALQLYAASNSRSGPSQWLSMLSIRNNQDNQREYEERAIYQISSLLTRRTCGDSAIIFQRNSNGRSNGNHHNSRWSHHVAPQGGTFVRLEHEWKEAHCHTFNCANARQRLVTSGMSVTRPKLRNRR